MTDDKASSQFDSEVLSSAFIAHSILLGSVTIAWNGAQERVFELFWIASGMTKQMAEAVFFTLRSDASQRDITRAVCLNLESMPDELKSEAVAAILELDKLAGERNAALHTMWDAEALGTGIIRPSQFVSPVYHNKKLRTDTNAQFMDLHKSLLKVDSKINLCLSKLDVHLTYLRKIEKLSPVSTASNSEAKPSAPSQGDAPPPQPSDS